jgi:predicted ester cyclase
MQPNTIIDMERKGNIVIQTENNKRLVRLVFEQGINQQRLELVDTLFSTHFIDHSTPDQLPGTQGVKDYFAAIYTGFPDMQVTIDDLIAEGDKIAVRTTWRGTHRGTYAHIEPTGNQVVRTMLQIFRIVDDKIAEEWNEGAELLA